MLRRLLLLALLAAVVGLHTAFVVTLLETGYACDLDAFLGSVTYLREGLPPYDYAVLLPGYPPSPNLNAPLSLALLWPLGRLSVARVLPWWTLASLLTYVAAMMLAMRPARPTLMGVMWTAALVGVCHTLQAGQIYTFLALLVTGALILAPRRPVLAAALLGLLVALKPNFGLLLLALFAAGHRRLALYSLGASVLWALLPAVLFGPQVYPQWLTAGLGYSNPYFGNGALAALAGYVGLPGLPFAALAALVGLYGAYRRRPDLVDALVLGVCLSLLCAPAAWLGYGVLLAPLLVARPRPLAMGLLAVPAYPTFIPEPLMPVLGAGTLFAIAMLGLLVAALRPQGVDAIQVRLHRVDVGLR
jgi:hypothetical protein